MAKLKNGWKLTKRKDSKTGKMRAIAIQYQNGKEMQHRWLRKSKKVTKRGMTMDSRRTNEVLVENYPQNREKWEDYHDQIDVKGIDNKT